ncbi:MAG: hypothetical protein AAGU01_03775 [Clostridiaceae bacterium]
MSAIEGNLGHILDKNKEFKRYSSSEIFENSLDISSSLVNDIENDIFKLNIFTDIMNELDDSLTRLIENKSITIGNVYFDSKHNELKVDLKIENITDTKLLNTFEKLITEAFLKTLSEYQYYN